MGRVKCPICGDFFNRDTQECYNFGNRYYHLSCCSEDFVYTERILELVKEAWGNYSRPRIIKQINQFTKQLSCDIKTIYNDLFYFFKIKCGDTQTYRNTIGIVPFIHSEAQRYYLNIETKEKAKDNITKHLQVQQQTERTVYVEKKPQRRKQFDLEVEKE